ncbi:MAG: tRNA (guanosine(46)-N7)-methyltransferase TrmB [Proteobacteria bacterium]|nr:tRNA (guanosine(46)-N7)-methyltransferase TrmB [Candidatus Enterousia scatequi]
MEKQELRTFGRRHGKKLSARKQTLIRDLLPTLNPIQHGLFDDCILEIGFGNGEHVRDLATNNPDCTIIGAEPFENGVAALLSAITDSENNVLNEYKNILIWPDDVRILLRESEQKFNQVWILHPDPWPKARHVKRRLLSAEFLNMLATHLSDNGKIIIGTDHWEYFDWIIDQVKNTDLSATIPDIETIQTRYQQKNKAGTASPKYMILHT